MASDISLKNIYNELKELRNDVSEMKWALIPEEKLSDKELKEFKKILKEMEKGKEKSFQQVFE